MENIFILNPDISYLDLVDVINRKLENAQSIADCLALSEPKENQQLFAGALGAISDLLEEIKQLFDMLCRKFKPA